MEFRRNTSYKLKNNNFATKSKTQNLAFHNNINFYYLTDNFLEKNYYLVHEAGRALKK